MTAAYWRSDSRRAILAARKVLHLPLENVMRKFALRMFAAALALAVVGPSLAQAHAPHYPKKDHPVLRQHKAEHTARKKAKKMEVKHGLLGLHG